MNTLHTSPQSISFIVEDTPFKVQVKEEKKKKTTTSLCIGFVVQLLSCPTLLLPHGL